MKARAIAYVCLCIWFILGSSALGQEGHPLTGSWIGDWGTNATQRNRVVIEMKWTGKELAGSINPGANGIPFKVATVNPSDWSLHIEAEGKDPQGRAVMYVIDGKISDIGTYNRDVSGTWNVGSTKGDFKIFRQ